MREFDVKLIPKVRKIVCISGSDRVCARVLQAKHADAWAEAHMGVEVEVLQVTGETTTLIIILNSCEMYLKFTCFEISQNLSATSSIVTAGMIRRGNESVTLASSLAQRAVMDRRCRCRLQPTAIPRIDMCSWPSVLLRSAIGNIVGEDI